jgi:FkbM family methyltransferase
VERFVRALLVAVPYVVGVAPLYLRAGIGKQVVVDGTSQEGIKIRCHLPDIIQMYIYVFGTWEPDLAAYMSRRLRPGDTFLDIGANIGYQSAVASKLVGPSGTVIAFEPAPSTIAALEKTIATNELTNVRLVAAAVSDQEGELPLFVGPSFGTGLTSTVAHNKILKEERRVRAAPLGSLVSPDDLRKARLIKIDVEGAEDKVLAGILKSIDDLADDVEIEVELTPKWWSDSDLRPIDVLRPFIDRGFHV